MNKYNPFKCPLEELDITGIEELINVTEGWFVEYKRECAPKSFGKEVSAFANSHGGWLVVGLDEDEKTGKPNGSGPGIDSRIVRKLMDSYRDSASSQCSPAPQILIKAIEGPSKILGLAQEKSVIVVEVPESRKKPHIHCTGSIYRRQIDNSEPIWYGFSFLLIHIFEYCNLREG